MAKEFKTAYKVTGDASGGVRAAQATRGELDKLNKSIEKQGKVSRETTAVFSSLTAKIAAGGAIAASALAFGFGKTVIETEKLRGSLVTMVGDVDRAGIAFDALTSFAERTPFTLDQSVQAFIKMKALGLEPTESALESFGNTAAAMGKDMSQMIEAVADASTFEFERLKEFGIKARQEGDNVSFTFQGVTTTVKKNSGEIVAFLETIGNTQFAGAMEDQMKRLPGLISNLQDNISGLFRAFGDVGGITLMGNAISWVSGLLADFTAVIRSGELIDEMSLRWEQFAGTISDSWSRAMDALETDFEGLFLSMGDTINGFIDSQSNTAESFLSRWLDALALLPISFQELFGAIFTIVGSTLGRMKDQLDIWRNEVKLGITDTGNQLAEVFDRISLGALPGDSASRAAAFQQTAASINQEIAALEEHQRILKADAASAFTNAADNVLAAKQKMVADREAAAAQRELEAAAAKSSLTLDDLAKSASGAAGDTAGLTKEAIAAEKAFQKLNDRLDPLAKLQREFTVEQALLVGKIAEGGEGVALYTQLLEKLKLEYAEDARAAVGFGAAAVAASDKAAAAAEKAADRAAKAAQKEAAKRAESLAKQAADVETFQKALERGIERMDDLGADLWRGFFTGAKNAMDSIKSFFQNWLGEMAHAAITRPILLNLTGAIGIGGTSTALAGGIGGVSGIGGVAGASGGGIGGLGLLGGIKGLLGGGGIGSAFTQLGSSLPGFLGGTAGTGILGPTAAGGNVAGGIFANSANVSNLSFGIAGILGGILGDKIFGGQGGIGGSLGAVIGTAILPGIGSVIGGALGGFLGGLFGGNKQPVLEVSGFSKAGESGSDSDATFDSLLGGGFLRTRRIDAATVADIGKDIAAFDDSIAQFLSNDQISAVATRLQSFERQMEGSAISIEELLAGRFNIILDALGDDIRSFVTEVSGLEEQAQRLALATTAQKIIDAAPELFEGRTFREFIAVAQAMQVEGEALSATFNRLVNDVVAITQQIELIKGFADSNLTADFDALVAQQGLTLLDLTTSLGDQIRTLRSGFTGSAADLQQLSILVSQRYDSEIAFLTQIQQISAGIGSGFQSLRDTINRDLFGDEAFFNDLTTRAEQLAANLKTLTDPAQISATVAEIQRLTGQAFGLLDEAGRAETGQGFLDFINGVESDAQAALTLARDLFIDESEVLRNLVADMAEEFGDPLEIAASAHEDAALALESAADSITESARSLASVGSGLVDAVRFGFALQNSINTGGSSVGTPGGVLVSSGGGGGKGVSTLEAANLTAQAIATAVLQAGAASAQAIKQSASTVQVQVVFPGRGMVNS